MRSMWLAPLYLSSTAWRRHATRKRTAWWNASMAVSMSYCSRRFDCRADLETTLLNYLKLYNHHIPQRAIDSKTPILALKEWQQKRPELFVKRVYDQAGLDT
jgi:hypothetical protein